ncbi:MAG TPA: DUF1015 domain-containing protein [Jiangellaceae bacterium]
MSQPTDRDRPLRLAPFRALRYNPAAVDDLGAVTCPPYDVIGADRVGAWEAADEHNIVRLILPRQEAGDNRYVHAASDLRRWLDAGVLVRDAERGLYVYEHTNGGAVALGLVGAISLHEPAERKVLPHEDVFPGPVEDRAALMAAMAAQLEPILLTYDGGGPASDVVDEVVTGAPDIVVHTSDGAEHRLWRIVDPAALRRIAADLADRTALIADGHHRYAAYLKLRERSIPGSGTGLAMLVDARRHPLRVGSIHRSVAGLAWPAALDAARKVFAHVEVLDPQDAPSRAGWTLDAVLARLADAKSRLAAPAFAVAADSHAALIGAPDSAAVVASMPPNRSQLWHSLDASVAQHLVLEQLWGVVDSDARVAYHHNADDAVAAAGGGRGVALLLTPPRHDDVLAIAAQGERMPRKSTSFGPKPRTGLLMRLLGQRDSGSSAETGG